MCIRDRCDTVYNIILMNILFPIIVTDVLVPKFTLTAEANEMCIRDRLRTVWWA